MIVVLTRKDTAEKCYCLATQFVTWNADADGNGTMVQFQSGVFRQVKETPHEVSCRVHKALGCPGKVGE